MEKSNPGVSRGQHFLRPINGLTGLIHTGVFLAYLCLCGIYFLERCTFADASVYLFHMVNTKSFFLPHMRLGAAFPQVLTVLTIHTGASFQTVCVVYALSYPAFYLFLYWLIVRKLRHRYAAHALVFLLLLGTRETFFNHIFEFQLALAYSCLFYALLTTNTSFPERRRRLFLVLTLALCLFTHVLVVPVLIFMTILGRLGKERVDRGRWILAGGGIIGVAVLRLLFMNAGGYQSEQFEMVNAAWGRLDLLRDLEVLDYVLYRGQFRIGHGLFLVAMVVFGITRRWVMLVSLGLFYTGYAVFFALAMVGESSLIMEKNLMPLGMITYLCCTVATEPVLGSKQRYAEWVIVVVSTFFFFRINGKQSEKHEDRVACQLSLLDELGNEKKGYLYKWNTDRERLFFTWAHAMETLILSTCEKGEAKTIYVSKELLPKELLEKENLFLSTFYDLERDISVLHDPFSLPGDPYREIQAE